MILVIDPRALVRDSVAQCLAAVAADEEPVLALATLEDWIAVADKHPTPKVTVLLADEHQSDLEVVYRRIKSLLPVLSGAGVVFVLEQPEVEQVKMALNCGARGVVPMSATLEVASAAIRLVKAGGTFIPVNALTSARSKSGGTQSAHRLRPLTRKQVAVITAIAVGRTNAEIALELNVQESTVRIHVRNLMKRVGARTRDEIPHRVKEHAEVGGAGF